MLDDGKVKLAIVICDNVGIPVEVYDLAKQQIHETTGLPASHLLMAATHTHSATTARGPLKTFAETELTDYQKFVARRISDGVRRALAQLEPARIGWGKIDEPSEVFNRRWFVTDASLLSNPFGGLDQVRMNPPRGSSKLDRPAGPTDPEISFVSVQSLDGRAIALLANYSLHYVGGVRSGDVSADYFGYFAKFIGEKLGSNRSIAAVCRHSFQRHQRRCEQYQLPGKVHAKVQTLREDAGGCGKGCQSRVLKHISEIEFHDWVPLAAKHVNLTLKTRQPTPEMIAHFEKVTSGKDDDPRRRHSREEIYADRIAKIQKAPKEIQIQLQALRIGDLGIAAIPFETFTETGLELKDSQPFRGHVYD